MGFKLDGNEKEDFQDEQTDGTESMQDSDGYYHIPQANAVQTHTAQIQKQEVSISKFVIFLIIAVVVALVLTIVPWNKKIALDSYLRLTMPELEQTLGVTFTENPEAVPYLSIPNGETDGFLVYSTSNKGLNVIYYNGRQLGISFDSKKYSVYGIKVGDSISHLLIQTGDSSVLGGEDGTGYAYKEYFNMLEDLTRSGSTSEYFVGVDDSVLILVVNDTTNRIVNIIYYYNTERLLQDIG